MEWFRWYHGAISDPKWPLIARKSGQNIGTVVSIWAAILEYASQSEPRGSIEGFDYETIDALFGYEDGTTETVFSAMIAKGLIKNGCIITKQRVFAKEQRDIGVTQGEWASVRQSAFDKYGYVCFYCGTTEGPFECDHVIPVCRGGSSRIENVVVACRACNRSKSSKLVEEWRA